MRKLLFVSLGTLFILFICSSLVFAAAGDRGPANVYKVTIIKFELYNGTSWITAFEGSSVTMDIASVTAGAAAGNFFSGLSVPDGSYTQVRVTPSDTFTISGRVGGRYTTAATLGGSSISTPTAVDEAEAVIDIPAPGIGTPDSQELPSTLTIADGVPSHSIRVNFDVSEAIQEVAASRLVPAQPSVSITMTAL